MELASSSLSPRLGRLIQPWLATTIIVLGLTGWVGWALWTTWFDRPLPPSALQAQQLRVNSSQLEQLTTTLKSYQNPVSAPALSTSVFNPTTGG